MKAKRREADLAEKALQEEQNRPLTAAEQATEKRRLLELQKAADLETAKELFGVSGDSIDTMDPQTLEDFDRLKDALVTKLNKYEVRWSSTWYLLVVHTHSSPSLGLASFCGVHGWFDTNNMRRIGC